MSENNLPNFFAESLWIKMSTILTLVIPVVWLIFVDLVLFLMFTDNYLYFIMLSIFVLTMLSVNFVDGSCLMFDEFLVYLNKRLAMPALRDEWFDNVFNLYDDLPKGYGEII